MSYRIQSIELSYIESKFYRTKLHRANYVRYLVIKTDENLNQNIHIHGLISRLNVANALISKLRYFVNFEILRSVFSGFPLLGEWGEYHPPPSYLAENLLIPPTWKNSPHSCHCSCAIFVLTSYSLYTHDVLILILIDLQYLQNVFF